MQIATFDFGTTAIKFVVLNEKCDILYTKKINIDTYIKDELIEQSPEQWISVFEELLKSYKNRDKIDSLICSGQMQDLIFIGHDNKAITNAILYNDQRGTNYVSKISDDIIEKTTINMNGSIPLTKMYWMKEHKSDVLNKTKKILFSPKDYITLYLTDKYVADTVNLSTTGMMDILKKEYIPSIEVNESLLPTIKTSGEVVGTIKDSIAKKLGLNSNVTVFAGTGDAGATTLASGIVKDNELSINLGTSGWIASIGRTPKKGVFNLCAINDGYYINVIPVLNASSVHKWIANMIFKDTDSKYSKMDELLDTNINYDTSVICLPYLVGERYPVADSKIRGCFFGLSPSTSLVDLALSALEGVAFSLKQGVVELGIKPKFISLVGGGALTAAWNQIFANVFKIPVVVYGDSEYLPSISLISSVLIESKIVNSYEAFIQDMLSKKDKKVYMPHLERYDNYKTKYDKFKNLYPALQDINK